MQLITERLVKIDDLTLPGDWKKILLAPSTRIRAQVIESQGLLQTPIVRVRDHLLIVGHLDVAACVFLNYKEVRCKIVDCSDIDARIAFLTDRVQRGTGMHGAAVQVGEDTRELISLMAKLERARATILPPGPVDYAAMAKDKLAAILGTTPATIRSRARRARIARRKNAVVVGPEGDALEVEDLRSPWMELDKTYLREVRRISKVIGEATTLVSSARACLTSLRMAKLPLHDGPFEKSLEALKLMAGKLRDLDPIVACPYCKNVKQVLDHCAGCDSSGYLTRAQVKDVPVRYMQVEDPVISFQGKMRLLDDFIPRRKTAAVSTPPPPPEEPKEELPEEPEEEEEVPLFVEPQER